VQTIKFGFLFGALAMLLVSVAGAQQDKGTPTKAPEKKVVKDEGDKDDGDKNNKDDGDKNNKNDGDKNNKDDGDKTPAKAPPAKAAASKADIDKQIEALRKQIEELRKQVK